MNELMMTGWLPEVAQYVQMPNGTPKYNFPNLGQKLNFQVVSLLYTGTFPKIGILDPKMGRSRTGRTMSFIMSTPIYTPEFNALCAEKAKEVAAVSEENMAAHAKWREKNATVLKRNATIKEANACRNASKVHIMVSIDRM